MLLFNREIFYMFNKYLIILPFILFFNFNIFAYSSPQKINVKTTKIKETELFDKFNVTGQCKKTESKAYYANISGKIDYITPNQGRLVKEGEIIITINKDIAEAKKEQAEANLKVAELNYNRDKALFAKKFISEETLENSRIKLAEAKLNFTTSNNSYEDMVISAPYEGVIGVIKFQIGDNVKAGEYLFSLISKDNISVFLEVPEPLYGKIPINTEVKLEDTNGNKATGKVFFTTPYISENGTIIVRVEVEEKNNLLHGSYLNAELIINRHLGLVVPEQAVLKNDNGNFIYLVDKDNIIKQSYIHLGSRVNDLIEVKSLENALQVGDQVVIEGLTKIQNGSLVEAQSEE